MGEATNTVTLRALVQIQSSRGKKRGKKAKPSIPGKGAGLDAGLRTTKRDTPPSLCNSSPPKMKAHSENTHPSTPL